MQPVPAPALQSPRHQLRIRRQRGRRQADPVDLRNPSGRLLPY